MAKAIPDGYHTVTASLTVKDGAAAIEFYQKAFGARETMRVNSPDGKIMHAEIQVGDSRIMLADESPGRGGAPPTPAGTATSPPNPYVPDVAAASKRPGPPGARGGSPGPDRSGGDRSGAA